MLSALIQSMVMAWQTQSYNEKRVVQGKQGRRLETGNVASKSLRCVAARKAICEKVRSSDSSGL